MSRPRTHLSLSPQPLHLDSLLRFRRMINPIRLLRSSSSPISHRVRHDESTPILRLLHPHRIRFFTPRNRMNRVPLNFRDRWRFRRNRFDCFVGLDGVHHLSSSTFRRSFSRCFLTLSRSHCHRLDGGEVVDLMTGDFDRGGVRTGTDTEEGSVMSVLELRLDSTDY